MAPKWLAGILGSIGAAGSGGGAGCCCSGGCGITDAAIGEDAPATG